MGITAKTRKILWARAGNRCALCRCNLTGDATSEDPEAVLGDECHIISKSTKVPRSFRNYNVEKEELDGYDSLILLCKNHHKLVDDQPNLFDVEKLKTLKSAHEHWVRTVLDITAKTSEEEHPSVDGITLLPRIKTGDDLFSILRGSHMYSFDNDDLKTREEMELVSEFAQEVQDWGDILDIAEAGHVVEAKYEITKRINDLEEMGLLVFGEQQKRRMRLGEVEDDWRVAVICVLRQTNESIIANQS